MEVSVGDHVVVVVSGVRQRGTVRYVGVPRFKPTCAEKFVGVELRDYALGSHDGIGPNGRRYFGPVAAGHAIFMKPALVERAPVERIARQLTPGTSVSEEDAIRRAMEASMESAAAPPSAPPSDAMIAWALAESRKEHERSTSEASRFVDAIVDADVTARELRRKIESTPYLHRRLQFLAEAGG